MTDGNVGIVRSGAKGVDEHVDATDRQYGVKFTCSAAKRRATVGDCVPRPTGPLVSQGGKRCRVVGRNESKSFGVEPLSSRRRVFNDDGVVVRSVIIIVRRVSGRNQEETNIDDYYASR